VKVPLLILVALCVTFTMVATASASPQRDYVKSGLLCIHQYEGSWTDPDAPYYGGLQMDWGFMSAYGYMIVHGTKISFMRLWGTADHWPIWAQLQAGRNGYRARGWFPWPNTAHFCRLL
jgi:hypothetical protein